MTKKEYKHPNDLIGKTVKVIKVGSSGHGRQLGYTFKVIRTSAGHTDVFYDENNTAFYQSEIDFMAQTIDAINETIQFKKSDIKELETEISLLNTKIDFMVENNIKIFDEDAFKAYAILKTLKSKSTDMEMATAIAAIIKG